MNSADSASRLEAARIFAQRVCGTLPLRRSSPLIDAWLAMKRCASSALAHLEVNSATGLLAGERRVLGEVGHQRRLAHAGRAARMIRLPGWKPPVMRSRSSKPDGVPVIEVPSRGELLELVELA